MSALPNTPDALRRFPPEVREAFALVQAKHDDTALQQVIDAALCDYLPTASPFPRNEKIRPDLRLIEDLGFDSLAIAETVFFFEDIFQVRIDNQDILTIHTVGELHTYIARRLREQSKLA